MAKSNAKKKATPAKKPVAAKSTKTAKKPSAPVAVRPNATSFKLIDNVTLPPRVRKGGASPYPFASMVAGQSFMVAATIERSIYANEAEADKAQLEECRRVANRLSGAVRRFTKRNEGFKFAVRTVANGKELGFDHDNGIVVQRAGDNTATA